MSLRSILAAPACLGVLWAALGTAGCADEPAARPPVPQSVWNTKPSSGAPADAAPAPTPQAPGALRVTRLALPLESDNPFAEHWNRAPAVTVPLLAQQMTMPAVEKAVVGELEARAVHDGAAIAFRVSWRDATLDGNVDVARFTDAVAVEFPLDPNASPFMGHAGSKVQILQWKAVWQRDIDVGFQDVQDLHPNFWSDLYWFAEGEFPFRVPEAFKDPRSMQWFVAHQAGNPVAAFSRTTPVAELVAEGWGTLTSQPESVSVGKGAWREGTWTVVFRRPLASTDPLDHQFVAGGKGQLAFAVWDGAAENVGGRKQWANWLSYEVDP